MTDNRKEVYNKYTELPNLSYNCIKYLMDNNDTVWKLLKYNDNNAWKNDSDHPNLTKAEKGALIYDGSPAETDFRVFSDVGSDEPWTIQACILRITPIELVPTNYIYGQVSMLFECYVNYKINALSNYSTRLNMVTQQLLEVFNGQEIGGLGRLFFDSRASSRCRMTIGGKIPFKGNALILTNWMA
jgi:hypothetical protein